MKELKDNRVEDRREFLKKAGKVAVTAPAIALLLSANAKPASANGTYDHIPPDMN